MLLLSGHLEHDNLDFVFRTTEKGTNFLNTIKQIHRLSSQDQVFLKYKGKNLRTSQSKQLVKS